MIKVIKKAFVVIGKEGSTSDGKDFIQKLWDDANNHFNEVAHLAKKDAKGNIVGIWEPCLIFLMHLNPGKITLAKDCIWQEWNVRMMQKRQMDGQNGQYQVMSI